MIEFLKLHQNLIAQSIGFIAMITAFISYQFNKHKNIMIMQLVTSALWTLHYLCLGVISGMALNIVNVLRNVVYSNKDKKWASYGFYPFLFCVINIVAISFTWTDYWCIFPLIASFFTTFGTWNNKTKVVRLTSIPVNVCWFTFNAVNGSWAGSINEAITFISVVVSIVRYDILKKGKNDG